MNRDEILALEPGEELDALVAEQVMGVALHWERPAIVGNRLEWVRCEASRGELRVADDDKPVPPYSNEIDAAWEVVEHLRNNHFAVRIEANRFRNLRLVQVWSNDTHPKGGFALQGESGDARHPEEVAEHVCKAALLAVMQV